MGPAGGAAIVAEEEGVQTALGGLASAAGLFTGPREFPEGGRFPRGDSDRRARPRVRPAGPWHGVPARRCAPLTGLFGQEREGATTQQAESVFRRYRYSQAPQGPAS
jgi:hypothetical protein